GEPGSGPRHRYGSGRSDHSDHDNRSNYVKLFIGSVPRTATEDDVRPLFEEHGDVVEVALIKDRKTGEQQGKAKHFFLNIITISVSLSFRS
uniref:RRM domain-containing protein n=1 Tax=Oryza brachyantha TaxID=4533 RepID=J3MVM4_ORYBR